jgi:para-nitrobenzyl esterase
MSDLRIAVTGGVVEGRQEKDLRTFLSVPYAAPLTDPNRFRAPQPVEPWQGVRDATRAGPCAPQSKPPVQDIDLEGLTAPSEAKGPDYLTLNVWAPVHGESPAPVMVFIHGGSFVSGSKDVPVYDGSSFARNGIVCITINYRVGIEGFLPIPGVPTNIGLRDMLAALQWVRENIVRFDGDPGNVTLFGESGGAWCIAALMTSPLAAGLFRRAICQSGHAYGSRNVALMQRLVRRLARRLRIPPTRDGFLSLSAEALIPAQDWVTKPSVLWTMRDAEGRDPSFGITRFLPVYGDDVLPVPPLEALAAGAASEIDLLIGTTSEEANLFLAPGGLLAKIKRWQAVFFLSRAIPRAREALRAYGLDKPCARAGDVLARAMTDLMFRWMTRRTAELHRGRSHVYEFDWRSPALGGTVGAAHAIELPFVFNTLAAANGERGLLGPNPPQSLADSVHALWIQFAKTGELPWPLFDAQSRQVFSLTAQAAAHEAPMPAAAFLPS